MNIFSKQNLAIFGVGSLIATGVVGSAISKPATGEVLGAVSYSFSSNITSSSLITSSQTVGVSSQVSSLVVVVSSSSAVPPEVVSSSIVETKTSSVTPITISQKIEPIVITPKLPEPKPIPVELVETKTATQPTTVITKDINYNTQNPIQAICRDGSTSHSRGRGTCSHHGGVDHYL